MRLFAAVLPPEDVLAELAAAVHLLRERAQPLRERADPLRERAELDGGGSGRGAAGGGSGRGAAGGGSGRDAAGGGSGRDAAGGGSGRDAAGGGSGRDAAGGGLRWAGQTGWHFTLAFYGEVAEESLPELSVRLERAAARTAPFGLALRGAGQFGRGAVLWVGAEGEIPVLRRLAERAEAAARRAGVPMGEHRRYRPHLTLAHSRDRADLRPYLTGLHGFTGTAWTVDELSLVRSHLPRGGVPGEQPRYEKVGGWPLGGGG
jgi:2'-5' RNA ligase